MPLVHRQYGTKQSCRTTRLYGKCKFYSSIDSKRPIFAANLLMTLLLGLGVYELYPVIAERRDFLCGLC